MKHRLSRPACRPSANTDAAPTEIIIAEPDISSKFDDTPAAYHYGVYFDIAFLDIAFHNTY